MSTNVNRPWLSVYDMDRHPVIDPDRVIIGPARPMGPGPNLFSPYERRSAVGASKSKPKPKTTKNKRRMQKASRKANRKKR